MTKYFIFQVFSVYKQEFYSYEISDSTLFGTLKDWISRDIKVPKTDLLFLFRNPASKGNQNETEDIRYCSNDNTLLEYLISNDEAILYVYKKDALFCEKCPQSKMPNLVKELFNPNSNLQSKFARNVYRQALFYVHSELRIVVEFKNAYLSLIQHMQDLCEKIKNKYITVTSEFRKICSKIEQFFQKKKNGELVLNNNVDSNAYPELAECLKNFELFLSNVERREQNLKDFGKQYKILAKNREEIEVARKEVREMFEKYDIQSR